MVKKLEDARLNEKSAELEAEAVALVRQYKILMPTAIRRFMVKLSGYLGWNDLYEVLK